MKTEILQHPWQSSAVKEDFCWLQGDTYVIIVLLLQTLFEAKFVGMCPVFTDIILILL